MGTRDRHGGDAGTKRRLADVLARCRDEVVERWMAAVRAGQEVSGVPVTALRDALPDYLERLGAELRADNPVTLEESGGAAWRGVAQEHALTRVRMGFDISQLVHEFIVLRRVLFDVAVREGVFASGSSSILAELLEAGIAVAVSTYVDARDYDARRRQAANVGFVSHELRNPLNAATLALERLKTEVSDGSSAFGKLERSLVQMRDLIDSVLDAARSESESISCRPVPTTLGDLLADPVTTAEAQAQRAGLEFSATFDMGTELVVDRDLTRSAIQNLLENAVKYTREGKVELAVEESDDHIVLHVRDTCAGISAEELRTIFEPFRRGTTGTKGTGLGLTIARRAIRLQGGDVEVESTGAHGCHFWITLPRRVRASAEAPGSPSTPE